MQVPFSVVVPKAPTNVITENTDTSSTNVRWTAPAQTGVDGYDVKLASDVDSVKNADDVTSTSKQFSGLRAGATYNIEIKAYKRDDNGDKLYSQVLTGSVTLSK